MKVLSIQNPWAYLIASGCKDVENRTWLTKYRGKILIHASLKYDSDFIFNSLQLENVKNHIIEKLINRDLVCGAIIGEANLFGIVDNSLSKWADMNQYHWLLDGTVLYDEPMYCKGKLGLWNYEK